MTVKILIQAERSTQECILYCVLSGIAIVLTLSTNICLLVGIRKYNALKLDSISAWIVKNLCIFDLCSIPIQTLTMVNNALGNRWALGWEFKNLILVISAWIVEKTSCIFDLCSIPIQTLTMVNSTLRRQ